MAKQIIRGTIGDQADIFGVMKGHLSGQ